MPHKKSKSRPPQARGQETRQKLLQAAIRSLTENHIHSLRFSQIAKAAGVPQPLMDYHFPNLEALLMEMVIFELDNLKIKSVAAIERHARNPTKALEAYIRAPFELCQTDLGFRAVWSGYYHLATINRTFSDFNRNVRKIGLDRIAQLVLNVVGQKQKKTNPNRQKILLTATSIQGLITGFGFMASAETDSNFKSMADQAVAAAFQVLEANFPSPA